MISSNIIWYNPSLKAKARRLRKQSTMSEVILWQHLKNRQLKGYRFLRQRPIDNFIVDFYCPDLRLAIEIDGATHSDKEDYDRIRQNNLENFGVRFLRFYDHDVKENIEGVLVCICDWIDDKF